MGIVNTTEAPKAANRAVLVISVAVFGVAAGNPAIGEQLFAARAGRLGLPLLTYPLNRALTQMPLESHWLDEHQAHIGGGVR